MDRIQGYTDEDEVDGQVSSLKGDTEEHRNQEGLGIVKGSFKWNEVEEKDGKDKGKVTGSNVLDTESDAASTLGAEAASERRFELRDISVIFPDEQLTVVTGTAFSPACFFTVFTLCSTGPTASGKTALLVSGGYLPAVKLADLPT